MPLMGSSVNWTQLRKESELEDIGQQKFSYLSAKENKQKKNIQELWDTWNTRRRKKKNEEIFQTIIAKNLPKLMSHQTTDPGSSEDTKQHKYLKPTPTYILLELQKPKTEKILKEARRKTILPIKKHNYS